MYGTATLKVANRMNNGEDEAEATRGKIVADAIEQGNLMTRYE